MLTASPGPGHKGHGPRGRHDHEPSPHASRGTPASSYNNYNRKKSDNDREWRSGCAEPAPLADVAPLVQTENRWIRNTDASEEEKVLKSIKGILNKLTLEKFEALLGQLMDGRISSLNLLRGTIGLIFDKAVTEPAFSAVYAQLCVRLCEKLPEYSLDGHTENFRRLLLNKCQQEFEKQPSSEGLEDLPKEEREYRMMLMKKAMLGNILSTASSAFAPFPLLFRFLSSPFGTP
eukprot:tig00000553_g2123.t1